MVSPTSGRCQHIPQGNNASGQNVRFSIYHTTPTRGLNYSLSFQGHPNLKTSKKQKTSLVFSNTPYASWSFYCLEQHWSLNLMSQKSTIKAFNWTREKAPIFYCDSLHTKDKVIYEGSQILMGSWGQLCKTNYTIQWTAQSLQTDTLHTTTSKDVCLPGLGHFL